MPASPVAIGLKASPHGVDLQTVGAIRARAGEITPFVAEGLRS